DVLLACLVAWSFVSLDRLRSVEDEAFSKPWRWVFFGLLGATSLVKGIGFGLALVASAVLLLQIWDRDSRLLRRLLFLPGWSLAVLVTLAWPISVAALYPEVIDLWLVHVTDRLTDQPERFTGD